MKHANAVLLLTSFGAKVKFDKEYALSYLSHRRFVARLNGWKLFWCKSARLYVSEVEYSTGEFDYRMSHAEITVKRFIHQAMQKMLKVGAGPARTTVNFGPDVRHDLAWSLRVKRPGKTTERFRDHETLTIGRSWHSGDMPDGVFIDWLKEKGLVRDQ